jgi:hypothetical protein
MKQTTIKIPIYRQKLTIIFDKDLSYVENRYNTKSLSDYAAVTLRDANGNYIIAFTEDGNLTDVAHEIVHLKNFIFIDCGLELDRYNDESEAYLTGWLFKKIYNFLIK